MLRPLLAGLFLGIGWATTALADQRSEQLAAIGINLFRATLAADCAIGRKGDAEGLLLLLVYTDNIAAADELGKRLLHNGPIRKLPIRVRIVDVEGVSRFETQPPAGIFLTQRLAGDRLQELVAFGKAHGIILYSPFKGQVERGVAAGQYVTARVQPYVNLRTLEESGIELKEFFLKIAKTYPP